MGKKKKSSEKLLTFYRGPQLKPTKTANDEELKLIFEALKECCCPASKKDLAYSYPGQEKPIRIIFGLSSALRCLKQKRTLALICDDLASPHVTKYLVDFSKKLSIPIIIARRLVDFAKGQLKLKTVMAVSLVAEISGEEELYYKFSNPRPRPSTEEVSSDAFNKLFKFLLDSLGPESSSQKEVNFNLPQLERIPATGKSKLKKEARKALKQNKQEHVCNTTES